MPPEDDLYELILHKETDRACLFSLEKRQFWIPRSLITYMLKEGKLVDEVTGIGCRITIPCWKAKDLGLL